MKLREIVAIIGDKLEDIIIEIREYQDQGFQDCSEVTVRTLRSVDKNGQETFYKNKMIKKKP